MLSYKGYVIKEYFANYFLHMSDVTFHMNLNSMEVHHKKAEPWEVTLVDTGEMSMTGGRLQRVKDYLQDGPFCFTYGDGVADVNIRLLIDHHRQHGHLYRHCGLTTWSFWCLDLGSECSVAGFRKNRKAMAVGLMVAFVVEPEAIDRIEEILIWEHEPLRGLAADGQLTAYHHTGFWQPMDTLRDRVHLEELWAKSKAPWKIW